MQRAEVFIVAGEPSADQHAAMLAESLRRRGDVRLRGVGQRRMAEAGVDLLLDSTGWSAIGVVQSLRRVPMLFACMRRLVRYLRAHPPELLVLVDFGAFNVRLARRVRGGGQRILYYFPPRSWSPQAEYSSLRGLIDRAATPFEWSAQRLREAGIDAEWVGHPVIDRIEPPSPQERAGLRERYDLGAERTVVGLLPGSRGTEVRCNAPRMLAAARIIASERPDARFLLSRAPAIDAVRLRSRVAEADLSDRVRIIEGVDPLVRVCDAAVCVSGTATLEAAAALCPMVIVYAGTWLMHVERLLRWFRPRFVGMPNIIADSPVAPELIDEDARPDAIARATLPLLEDGEARRSMVAKLSEVRDRLGEPGVSDRVARIALDMIEGMTARDDDELRRDG